MSETIKILGIESSCDETAAAVVENGRKILSSVISTQVEEHRKYGGVVPEIASRRHCENICWVVEGAMKEAGLTFEDLDAIAVTYAPGLIGALLVGVNYAKGLSLATGKPLVPTHHLRSHVASNYLAHPDLEPPFLCMIASGGHSHIVEVLDYTKFHVIGRTRDDAAGEALIKQHGRWDSPILAAFLSTKRPNSAIHLLSNFHTRMLTAARLISAFPV